MISLAELVRSLTGAPIRRSALPVVRVRPGMCVFANDVGNAYDCGNPEANRYATRCVHINLVEGTCCNPRGSYRRAE